MISISSYGAKDKNKNKTTIATGGTSTSSGQDFLPVNLWGQYFDDTKDINGDMTVNGTIKADKIITPEMEAENLSVDNLDVKERLTAQAALITDLEAEALKADKANLKAALIQELAASNLVTENLTVTQGAYFFELIIDKIKAAGGAILLTPADGFKIDKIVDNGNSKTLYFRSEDGDKKIHNMWQRNDQAISQNFNNAKVGKSYNVSNKFWWALVTDTNNESNNGQPVNVNFGTQENPEYYACHYITVSTAQNNFIGDVNPEIGDDVAMLGHRGDDESRKSAQYLAAYASLDIDLKAPLFAQYKGIDDFDLAKHKITWFSSGVTAAGEVKGVLQNEITGSFRTSSGQTIEDLIEEASKSTSYRIICNPSSIRIDGNGNITPANLNVVILVNEKGNVTEYNTVPNFLKVELHGVVNNNDQLIDTRNSSNNSLSFSTTGLNAYDWCYVELKDSTKNTTYDKCNISKNVDGENGTVTIEGELTEIDRLVDNGSLAKVSYDTSNSTYSVTFNINVGVYHFKEGNSFNVTPSTTPSISNYSLNWEWDKKNENVGDSAQGTISAPPSGSTFVKTATTIPYSTNVNTNDCKSFLKLTLLKNGNVVDTYVIHVTMKAEAIFEIIQGEIPHITSTVMATINEDFDQWSNNISRITQFADRIESTVETLTQDVNGLKEGNSSIISQTASEILAQVSDGLSTTGIDIVNHIISLNADNTNINGSLNIYGVSGTGFKVWDDVVGSATKSVQITNINLGQVQSYVMTNILNNSNIESANVIGMDGAAFMPDYNRFMWWGKSTDNKYEFIVRSKYHNFRIREEGIFRTLGVYGDQTIYNGGSDGNTNAISTSGKDLLGGNIGQESYWADIATTSPVYEFKGSHDFTTDGNNGAGSYPDTNFRRCGVFVCVSTSGFSTVYLPHARDCAGRTIFIKNLGRHELRIATHGTGKMFIPADGGMTPENELEYIEIQNKSTILVSAWGYWIQFYCG